MIYKVFGICLFYVSGICVVLVRHNTTKSCAISLNTKARLHIRSYIIKLHMKTMLHANIHVQTVYRGTQLFSLGPMGWAYTQDYQQYPKLPCLRVSRVLVRVPRT